LRSFNLGSRHAVVRQVDRTRIHLRSLIGFGQEELTVMELRAKLVDRSAVNQAVGGGVKPALLCQQLLRAILWMATDWPSFRSLCHACSSRLG